MSDEKKSVVGMDAFAKSITTVAERAKSYTDRSMESVGKRLTGIESVTRAVATPTHELLLALDLMSKRLDALSRRVQALEEQPNGQQ